MNQILPGSLSLYAAISPLDLKLKPSLKLIRLLRWIHIILALVELSMPGHWILKFILIGFLIWHYHYIIPRFALLTHPNSVAALSVNHRGEWILEQANGERFNFLLQGDTFRGSLFVILMFNEKKCSMWKKLFPRCVFIFNDHLSKSEFRRLRVRLLSYFLGN